MRDRGQRLLGCIVVAATLAAPTRTWGTGFYLMEASLLGAVNEQQGMEGGVGLSLYSDELGAGLTMGAADLDGGHRVKEWWFDSRPLGPVMGTLPPSMRAAGFDEPLRQGRANVVIPFRSWRFGADHTTGHWLEWDASAHVLLNLGGFLSVSHSVLQFGPTAGVGANLSWWQGWRGNEDGLINTGKITAEAGWIAGYCANNLFYVQARLLAHVDAFGIHQHKLALDAVMGISLVERGLPLGLELRASFDHGNDTVDLAPATAYTLGGAISYRLLPRPPSSHPEGLLDAFRGALEATAPAEPPPADTPEAAADSSPPPREASPSEEDPGAKEPPVETAEPSTDAPEDSEAEAAPDTSDEPTTGPMGPAP